MTDLDTLGSMLGHSQEWQHRLPVQSNPAAPESWDPLCSGSFGSQDRSWLPRQRPRLKGCSGPHCGVHPDSQRVNMEVLVPGGPGRPVWTQGPRSCSTHTAKLTPGLGEQGLTVDG